MGSVGALALLPHLSRVPTSKGERDMWVRDSLMCVDCLGWFDPGLFGSVAVCPRCDRRRQVRYARAQRAAFKRSPLSYRR